MWFSQCCRYRGLVSAAGTGTCCGAAGLVSRGSSRFSCQRQQQVQSVEAPYRCRRVCPPHVLCCGAAALLALLVQKLTTKAQAHISAPTATPEVVRAVLRLLALLVQKLYWYKSFTSTIYPHPQHHLRWCVRCLDYLLYQYKSFTGTKVLLVQKQQRECKVTSLSRKKKIFLLALLYIGCIQARTSQLSCIYI